MTTLKGLRWQLATQEDVDQILPQLREADVRESSVMYGVSPTSLFRSIGFDRKNTFIIASKTSGKKFALAGVQRSRAYPGTAMIWCISTPEIMAHKIEFLRYSKTFIEDVSQPYSLIYNWVHAANTVHIEWLRWLGFSFIAKRENFGAGKETFYSFVKHT